MSGLCRYSGVFGEPGSGAHSYRLGGLAAVDLLATGGVSFLLTRYALGWSSCAGYLLVFVLLILVAIVVHEMFCVNTRLNSVIFDRPWQNHGKTGS
jgi:hypothetical protein